MPGRLSVFAGGCTLEAAEAVCKTGGELDLLERMPSLVEKSLLRQEGEEEPRFGPLETIREYAGEKLAERGEGETIRETHARYFLGLAEQLWHPILGPWSRDSDPNYQTPRPGALSRFWYGHGSYSEGWRWLDVVLAHRAQVAPAQQLLALDGAAQLASRGGLEQKAAWSQEYLCIAQQLGDQRAIARALEALAGLACEQGDFGRGATLREQALERWRVIGDPWHIGVTLSNLGLDFYYQGDYQRAEELYEEGSAIYRQLGEDTGLAVNLHRQGYISLMQRNVEQAADSPSGRPSEARWGAH